MRAAEILVVTIAITSSQGFIAFLERELCMPFLHLISQTVILVPLLF